MSGERQIVCIICPNGCRMHVLYNDETVLSVKNARCPKGCGYAHDELFKPVRTLTTTMRVENGAAPLVSVRSDRPIPKEKMLEAVKALGKMKLRAPILFHQVIVENLMNTGADIISTRAIPLDNYKS